MLTDTISLPIPTKESYIFVGWYENEDFSGDAVLEIPKGSSGNKTFYAKWRSSTTYLFNKGDTCSDITGGWTKSGWTNNVYTFNNAATITTTLNVSTSAALTVSILGTANKIDLTNVNKIYANVTDAGYGYIAVLASSDTNFHENEKQWSRTTTGTAPGTISFDVSSLTGEYYIAVKALGSNTNKSARGAFSQVWMVE